MTNSYLTAEFWFSDSVTHGFSKVLLKRDLQDTSKCYLVGDVFFIECKLDVISVVKDFSSN
jgi:hypothetical protein